MNHKLLLLIILISFSCGRNGEKDKNEELKVTTEDIKFPTKEITKETKEQPKPIGTGRITTIADGQDVRRVNLWNSTSSNRSINCYLTNGEKVKILKDEDPYYLIETENGSGCKGYCMKGFVIKRK